MADSPPSPEPLSAESITISAESITTALAELPGWRFERDEAQGTSALHKTFQFQSFREAVSFIVRMAFAAERLDHHPELRNVYSRVELTLRTHDAGDRVTTRDLRLARAIESFSWV